MQYYSMYAVYGCIAWESYINQDNMYNLSSGNEKQKDV